MESTQIIWLAKFTGGRGVTSAALDGAVGELAEDEALAMRLAIVNKREDEEIQRLRDLNLLNVRSKLDALNSEFEKNREFGVETPSGFQQLIGKHGQNLEAFGVGHDEIVSSEHLTGEKAWVGNLFQQTSELVALKTELILAPAQRSVIEGGKIVQRKVKLFDAGDIQREVYTPLVRQLLWAEDQVPNAYSAVQSMIDESNKAYLKALEERGTDIGANDLSNALTDGKALVSGMAKVATSATAVARVFDPSLVDTVKTVNTVITIVDVILEGGLEIGAQVTKSDASGFATSIINTIAASTKAVLGATLPPTMKNPTADQVASYVALGIQSTNFVPGAVALLTDDSLDPYQKAMQLTADVGTALINGITDFSTVGMEDPKQKAQLDALRQAMTYAIQVELEALKKGGIVDMIQRGDTAGVRKAVAKLAGDALTRGLKIAGNFKAAEDQIKKEKELKEAQAAAAELDKNSPEYRDFLNANPEYKQFLAENTAKAEELNSLHTEALAIEDAEERQRFIDSKPKLSDYLTIHDSLDSTKAIDFQDALLGDFTDELKGQIDDAMAASGDEAGGQIGGLFDSIGGEALDSMIASKKADLIRAEEARIADLNALSAEDFGRRLTALDDPNLADIDLLGDMVKTLRKERAAIQMATQVGQAGLSAAAMFYGPLAAAGTLVAFIQSTTKAINHAMELTKWEHNEALATAAISPYHSSVLAFVKEESKIHTHHSLQAAAKGVQFAADVAATAGVGFPPVAVVAQLVSATAQLASTTEEFIYARQREAKVVKAWKITKAALDARPFDRKAAVKARQINPSLSKYSVAHAMIQNDPVGLEIGRSIGLTPTVLASAKGRALLEQESTGKNAYDKIVEYLELRYDEHIQVYGKLEEKAAASPWTAKAPARRLSVVSWYGVYGLAVAEGNLQDAGADDIAKAFGRVQGAQKKYNALQPAFAFAAYRAELENHEFDSDLYPRRPTIDPKWQPAVEEYATALALLSSMLDRYRPLKRDDGEFVADPEMENFTVEYMALVARAMSSTAEMMDELQDILDPPPKSVEAPPVQSVIEVALAASHAIVNPPPPSA